MSRLTAIPLTWELCKALAPKVNPADSWECHREGHSVEQALASGLLMGKAYAVTQEDTLNDPVGAFGYTCSNTIWSLWGHLTRRQSLQVLRETPEWVAGMVERAKPHVLWNYADPNNTKAVEWLRASGAFLVDDEPIWVGTAGPSLYFEARRKAALHV